jgi:hypothetical protein
LQLDWHRNTLGKGIVQHGAEADCKRQWSTVLTSLQQLPNNNTSSNKLTDLGGTPSSSGAAAAGGAQLMVPMLQKPEFFGIGFTVQTVILLVLLMVLAVLLLLLVGVWLVGGDMVRELRNLTTAINASKGQCLH